jgi:hypothetical protein
MKRYLFTFSKTVFLAAFPLLVLCSSSMAQSGAPLHRDVSLNLANMTFQLANAPMEYSSAALTNPLLLSLPLPDGNERVFKIVESPIMSNELATLYPTYKTYSLVAEDNPQVTGRICLTAYGLNASIFMESGTMGIRPLDLMNPNMHLVYFGIAGMPPLTPPDGCQLEGGGIVPFNSPVQQLAPNLASITNGATRRTYRFATVTTGEFTANNGGTVASATAVVIASVNAIQAIFDRELAIRFNLLTPVTYTNAATDPFTPDLAGGDSRPNQATEVVALNFSPATYDIGHVLHNSTGNTALWNGGGVAGVGIVCANSTFFSTQTGGNPQEPDGLTGPDRGAGWSGSSNNTSNSWYGLFAHEVGHQFSMLHTHNGSGNSCTSGISATTAYEIGSGTTLMSYNGLCSSTQNIPDGGIADDYFHANSLDRAVTFMNTISCQTSAATGNTPPVVNANPCGGTYTIPVNTPFTLTGSGTDANGDAIYYSWEQYDEDGAGTPTQGLIGAAAGANPLAPLFRSYPPKTTPSRTFPDINFVVNNSYSTDFEPLPTVARTLNFRLTGRDYNPNGGGIHSTDLAVAVNAASGAFSVTAPNGGESISAGGTFNVTWTANTTAFCTNVNIKLSIDGGFTYPYTLASNVPNSAGSRSVTIPAGVTNTSLGRIKVECADNACVVFFDISNANFSISSDCAAAASNICPTPDANFAQGNPGLVLPLAHPFGGAITAKTFNIVPSDPNRSVGTFNIASTGCDVPGFNNKYQTLPFTVSRTGVYTFSITGSSSFAGVSIYDAASFSASSACSGFISSNYRHNGGGNVTIFPSATATLTACASYILVGTDLNAAPPFTTTVNISGAGTIFVDAPSPSTNYAYTYVAVNTTTGQVRAVSATANFTSLPLGVYNILGASYRTDVNPAAWLNQTIAQILSTGNCVLFSTNFKKITITGVLSVELLSLQATPLSNSVKITWQTATETNNKGFEVERFQATGGNWDMLGFVAAKGKAARYDFMDNSPLSTNYYRLRQIDNDGKVALSKVVTATFGQKSTLKVYPNPVSNVLTVETNNRGDFHIFNLLGQQVISGKSAAQIDVSPLPQGNYFFKIGTEQVKFIKQ